MRATGQTRGCPWLKPEPLWGPATLGGMEDYAQGLPSGLRLFADLIDPEGARRILKDIRAVIRDAPLYTPAMPRSGRPMSVRMTNCGAFGWFTDKDQGYRYVGRHPVTGLPWPALPDSVLGIWRQVAGYPAPPEACLVNYYDADARMGLHQDTDEEALDAPVVSISLGDTALFRVGGRSRGARTRSLKLVNGTVIVLDGDARHCFHGVDRIFPGSSALLAEGGRFNLTLRRVTPPESASAAPREGFP